jgi:peptide/nickel transport system permease protein
LGAYELRRLLGLIPVLFGISLLVFAIPRLVPGDPAIIMLGERSSAAARERLREELGLNRPLFFNVAAAGERGPLALFDSQYFGFVGRVLRGDMGRSIFNFVPVWSGLMQRFPATFELSVVAMLFAVNLGWLPPSGRIGVNFAITPTTGFYVLDGLLQGRPAFSWDALKHLILPAVALGTIPLAIVVRMTRSAMLEVLGQDYVRTARAKGLEQRMVVNKHALRNALLPVITVIGLSFGSLLSGAILTETVFAWPGVGRWIYDAIASRDYPIIQGGVLFVAFIFVIVNMLVDLSYALIDPRIQYS